MEDLELTTSDVACELEAVHNTFITFPAWPQPGSGQFSMPVHTSPGIHGAVVTTTPWPSVSTPIDNINRPPVDMF